MSKRGNDFYEDNIIYKQFEAFFDLGKTIFDFTNECIRGLKTCKMDNPLESDLRHVVTLLCFSSFKTFRSILFLCNIGHGEDAMSLTRTIFDNFVTLRYIQKNPKDRIYKFMNYLVLENKFRLDQAKQPNSKMLPEVKKLYCEGETELLENYNKIKGFYVKPGRDEDKSLKKFKSGRWTGIDLRQMAKETGLEDDYDCYFRFHSCFSHPHPLGLSRFYVETNSESSFRPGPSMNGVIPALCTAMRYFLFTLKEWTNIFGLARDKEIDNLLNETITLDNNYSKMVHDMREVRKKYRLKLGPIF